MRKQQRQHQRNKRALPSLTRDLRSPGANVRLLLHLLLTELLCISILGLRGRLHLYTGSSAASRAIIHIHFLLDNGSLSAVRQLDSEAMF